MADITGTLGPDVIPGNLSDGRVITVQQLVGEDTLTGLDGDDVLNALSGNDEIFGGPGNDIGNGNDGNDTVYGGKDDDQVYGGKGNDLVRGDIGDDSVFGSNDNDSMFGGKGRDTMFGGKNNDLILGDLGDDLIYGDLGSDTMTGGGDNDVFAIGRVGDGKPTATTGGPNISDADIITDFRVNGDNDVIQLLGGLQFNDLQFIDGTGSNGVPIGSAIVRDTGTGEYLVIIPNKTAAQLQANPSWFGFGPATPPGGNGPGILNFAQPIYSGTEGSTVTVDVTRTGGSQGALSANYIVIPSAASGANAADYTASPQATVNFADGQTAAQITFNLTNDGIAEGTETAILQLQAPTGGGTLGTLPATNLSISDQQTVPPTPTPTPVGGILNFNKPTISGAEGSNVSIDVIRTGGSQGQVSVNYLIIPSASNGATPDDYTATPAQTLIFADGQTAATINFNLKADNLSEGTETAILQLQAPVGSATLGTLPAAVMSIFDVAGTGTTPTPTPTPITGAGVLNFGQPTYSGTEGSTVSVNVVRTNGSQGAVSVNYTIAPGGANGQASSADYTVAQPQTLTLADGQTAATISFNLTNDGIAEGTETAVLQLQAPTGNATLGTLPSSVMSILDGGTTATPTPSPTPGTTAASIFSFSANNYTVAEGSQAGVTVIRTGDTTSAATIGFGTVDGSASSTGSAPDYTPTTGTLNFAPGQTSATFLLPTLNDSIAEPSETVNVFLSSGNVGAVNPATVTIFDAGGTSASPTPTPTPIPTSTAPSIFQFSAANYSVNEGSTVNVTVTRTGGTAAATINYATVDGSASSSGTAPDYTVAAGSLNFAAGQNSATFTVTALTDAITEGPETVNLVLSGGTVGSNPATLTINDVVATPTPTPTGTPTPTPTPTTTTTGPSVFSFSAGTYSVNEGQTAPITITRTGDLTQPATILLSSSDGTALAPGDYNSVAQAVSFAAGQASVQVPVQTLFDSLTEPNETVNLFLAGGTLASPSTAVLTIIDSNAAPTTFFSYGAGTSVPPNTSATFTINRIGNTTVSASIDYLIVAPGGGQPINTLDYTITNPAGTSNINGGTVNFNPGQSTVTLSIFNNPALTNGTVNLGFGPGPIGAPPSVAITLV